MTFKAMTFKTLRHPRWLIPTLVIVCLVVGVALVAVCGGDRVLVAGTDGYSVSGKFAVQTSPPKRGDVKALLKNRDFVLWKSRLSGDEYTGKLISPPFAAPVVLGMFVAGYPDDGGNELLVRRVDTGEQLPLLAKHIGDRWRRLAWVLPLSWHHRSIQIIAIDNSQKPHGWLGISSPLQSSLLTVLKTQLSFIPIVPFYLLYFLLFLIPGLLLAILAIPRMKIHSAFTVILAMAINSAIGYLTFWVYFLNHSVGIAFSIAILLATVVCLGLLCFKKPFLRLFSNSLTTADVVFPTLAMLIVGLFYISILYTVNPGISLEENVQVRFFLSFPPDNLIPHLFAERLYAGKDPRLLLGDWLSSDRPPLQTGIILVQRPISFLSGSQSGLHYQLLSTVAQCSWVAAVWAIGRMLQLSGRQMAIVLSFCVFSGFFLFNSLYVWPKLLAAAMVIFVFALLLPSVLEPRRLTAVEAGLAGGVTVLGLLAHGGVVFTLPAMLLLLARPRSFPGMRQILAGCLAFAIILAPWMAYQKFYNPPGDRLVKMHIAGVIDIDSRSFAQAFNDSYSRLSIAQIANNKWENLRMLVDHPNSDTTSSFVRRQKEFFHIFWALGALNVGWLLWIASFLTKKDDSTLTMKGVHSILGVSVFSLLFWVVIMFGPNTTIIHAGSYATMMLLFIGLATLLTRLPRLIIYSLLTFQIVTLLMNWIISSSFNTFDRITVVPNIFMLGSTVIWTIGIIVLLKWIAAIEAFACGSEVKNSSIIRG